MQISIDWPLFHNIHGFEFTLLLVFGGVILYFWIKNWQFFRQKAQFLKALKKAPTMSSINANKGSSAEHDFVRVQGTLAMPETATPINQKSCGYWAVIARAEFTSKKKKPDKGEQTHQPVIYRAFCDEPPLMMKSDTGALIHLDFKENFKVMLNLHCKRTRRNKAFSPEMQAVAKPKYKSYIADEFWLQCKEPVTVWGHVVQRNQACITLSGSAAAKQPNLIFAGRADELYSLLANKKRLSFLYFVLLLVAAISYWLLLDRLNNEFLLLLYAIAIIAVCQLVLKRIKRNPLRNPE